MEEENLENLKKKPTTKEKLLKFGVRTDAPHKRIDVREKKQEQRIEEQTKKMEALKTKRQSQLEHKQRKLQLQELKRETSLSGKMLTKVREQQKRVKARQKGTTVQRQPQPSKKQIKAKYGKAGENFIVINGILYQRKGTVAISKPKSIKKKKSDGDSITI